MSALTETWQIHNRINIYLLEAIPEENLKDQLSSKGRNVGEQFAHINNVRLMWLKASNPALLEGLPKIEKDQITKPGLIDALNLSAQAIETLIDNAACIIAHSAICRKEMTFGIRIGQVCSVG